MKIYDRNKKIYLEEKESKILNFLYRTIIGRACLKLLTKKSFSILAAKFLKSNISKLLIKKYNVDNLDTKEYNSFNSYFMRKYELNMKYKKDELISPAESKVSVYQITNEMILDIKGTKYTLEEIIQDKLLVQEFKDGICLVFRLTPENYHRYIFVDDVERQLTKKINRCVTYCKTYRKYEIQSL